MEKSYLTADGAKKLKLELDQLTGPARENLAKRLRAAIEMGDLSENADYTAAKEEQGFLEGRILELEMTLKDAVIIDGIRSRIFFSRSSLVRLSALAITSPSRKATSQRRNTIW